jgi:hypothetical protein
MSWTVDFRNIAKLVDSITKETDKVSLFGSISFVYILSIRLLNFINNGDMINDNNFGFMIRRL